MDLDLIREHCLARPETTEGFPFGEDVLVFKVAGKMFATLALERVPQSMNLKCQPDVARKLRDEWDAVQPGYHMNKKHWNTVVLDGTVPPATLKGWIDESYRLVAAGLPKYKQRELGLIE